MLRFFHRPLPPRNPQWPSVRRSPVAKSRPRRSRIPRDAGKARGISTCIFSVITDRTRHPARCWRRVRRPTEGEENFPPRKALKSLETRKSLARPSPASEERAALPCASLRFPGAEGGAIQTGEVPAEEMMLEFAGGGARPTPRPSVGRHRRTSHSIRQHVLRLHGRIRL